MLLAVVSPMHISVPISAGTLICVCDRNSIHIAPPSANGTAERTISGSIQLWKLMTRSRNTSTTAKRHAGEQARIAFPHRLDLAAERDRDALGRVFLAASMTLSISAAAESRSRPSHIGVHVENRSDVELRNAPSAPWSD